MSDKVPGAPPHAAGTPPGAPPRIPRGGEWWLMWVPPRRPEPVSRNRIVAGWLIMLPLTALIDGLVGFFAGLAAGWRIGLYVWAGLFALTIGELALVAVAARKRNAAGWRG